MDNPIESHAIQSSTAGQTPAQRETYNEAIIRYGALAFLVLMLALCALAVIAIGWEVVFRR